MDGIADFQCTYEDNAGFAKEDALATGIHFPAVYREAGQMAAMAAVKKEKAGDVFCELPFCHTAEAEAMGADIRLGDGTAPPRARSFKCTSLKELGELSEMNLSDGRMREILTACRLLFEKGETVVLNISGPFTIWNSLIDLPCVLRAVRKEPETMVKLFGKVRYDLLRLIREAKRAGVTAFSYADAAGGVNILGPSLAGRVTRWFTVPFLQQAQKITDKDCIILLCPKTTLMLTGTEAAMLRDIPFNETLRYGEACKQAVGKARILGQMCLKRRMDPLPDRTLKEVILRADTGGEQ